MKNLYSEDAFTGLEAAIVLIAFVVVAAVFSYVVLGAGFFTSQTAQATVHTGVQQASSSMELVGNVYGIQGTGQVLKSVNVTIALTAGGTPLDLSQMVISYKDDNGGYNASLGYEKAANCAASIAGGTVQTWCIAQGSPMLGNNVQDVIIVGLPPSAQPNVKIFINFQPAVGAVLPITRTIPGGITPVQPIY